MTSDVKIMVLLLVKRNGKYAAKLPLQMFDVNGIVAFMK